jgi:hypothetical protein
VLRKKFMKCGENGLGNSWLNHDISRPKSCKGGGEISKVLELFEPPERDLELWRLWALVDTWCGLEPWDIALLRETEQEEAASEG